MDRVHEEVNGLGPRRWSMDRRSCFVYVHIRLLIQQTVSYSLLGIEL